MLSAAEFKKVARIYSASSRKEANGVTSFSCLYRPSDHGTHAEQSCQQGTCA